MFGWRKEGYSAYFWLTVLLKNRVICKYHDGITLKATYRYNKWNNKEENTNQTQTCSSLNLFFFTYPFLVLRSLSPESVITNIHILNILPHLFPISGSFKCFSHREKAKILVRIVRMSYFWRFEPKLAGHRDSSLKPVRRGVCDL
jgi:hypothetical protein